MEKEALTTEVYEEIIDKLKNLPNDFLFDICMGKVKSDTTKTERVLPEIDFQDFYDMLIKFVSRKYITLLYQYHAHWLGWYNLLKSNKKYKEESKENSLRYQLEISKALKLSFEMQEMSSNGFEFSLSNHLEKVRIKNDRLKHTIHKALIDEFKFHKLNYVKMTKEETIEALKIEEERNWLLEQDELFDTTDLVLDDNDNFTDLAIETYMFFRRKRNEITSEFVSDVIMELENEYYDNKNLGAKVKNIDKGNLALRLSYLFRIEDFLEQSTISDIDNFQLSNSICRVIAEYLEFVDLSISLYKPEKIGIPIDKYGNEIISNEVYDYKFIGTISRSVTNIRSMIKNAKDRTDPNLFLHLRRILDENVSEKINILWNIKHGKLKPEENLEIVSLFNLNDIFSLQGH